MKNMYTYINLCSLSGVTYREVQFINLVVRQFRHLCYTYFILCFAAHKALSGQVLYFCLNLKYKMNFTSKMKLFGN
jgi:hypothetical protein